jgi:hypothetical protein
MKNVFYFFTMIAGSHQKEHRRQTNNFQEFFIFFEWQGQLVF